MPDTLTHEELTALRWPLAPENYPKYLAVLEKLGWSEPTPGADDRHPARVYYGPHPCERCGAMIVKQAREEGPMEFDVPEGPIYPNTRWMWHDCPKRETPEPHPVRPHTPGFPAPTGADAAPPTPLTGETR